MNEKELLKELKRIEDAEKLQERIIEKKKAHVEKLSLIGNSETIEKAKAQEERAITVLERIREDKRRIESELKNVTKEVEDEWDSKDKGLVEEEFNKNSNGLEMQAKKVITIEDILKTLAENLRSFLIDTPKENKEKRRLEEIEIVKLKVDITNRWIEIVKNNPGLTQSELKIVYEDVYPNDSELEQRVLVNYLREREKEISSKDKKKAQDIGDIKLILFIFLIIIIIGFLGTCIYTIGSI